MTKMNIKLIERYPKPFRSPFQCVMSGNLAFAQ